LPSRNLWLAFGGLFAVVIGLAFFAPVATHRLMTACVPVMARFGGALAAFAPRDVTRSLSRTSAAIAALMLAVSVAIGLRLMIGSFRTTVAVWLESTLRGDVYLSGRTLGGTAATTPIAPAALAELRKLPGVRRIDLVRSTSIDSDRGRLHVSASSRPFFDDPRLYKDLAIPQRDLPARLGTGDVLVSEPLASRLGLRAGRDVLELRSESGPPRRSRVLGIYYDYASTQGQLLMDLEFYRDLVSDPHVTGAALVLDDPSATEAVSNRLARDLSPIQALRVRPNRQLRRDVFAVFDQAFAITRALVLLATGVATLGVLSALLALQLERRRSYGMLRALGVTGRQAARQVLTQTSLLGGAAALLAVPTGIVLAVLLIYVINRRAFGWTLHMELAIEPFAAAFALAMIAAGAAAVLPAWRLWRSTTAELLR
jgi:putative ABC transport system permease protein